LFRPPGYGRGAVVDWIHLAGHPATFNLAAVVIRLGRSVRSPRRRVPGRAPAASGLRCRSRPGPDR